MDLQTHTILSEATSFSLLSLAFALAVFGIIRQRRPELRWYAHGNVYSQPYGALDLAVVGVFLLIFLAPVLMEAPEVQEGDSPPVEMAVEGGAEPEIQDTAEAQNRSEVVQLEGLVYGALLQFFLIGSLLTYLTVGRGFNPSEIFGFRLMSLLRAFAIALLVFVPVFLIVVFSAYLFDLMFEPSLPEARPQRLVETFVGSQSQMLRGMIAISAVVVASICEEIVFRGFLYPVIKRHTERIFATIFTGLIFGIIHYHIPSVGPLWVFGILLAIAYQLTGCLWVPIFLHALFNGFQTLTMIYS